MFDFIEKLKLAQTIKFERGKLSLMGVPIAIVPVDFLVGIQNSMVKKFGYKIAYEILYNQYKESSRAGCAIFVERYNVEGFDAVLDILSKVFMSTGYGKIVRMNANRYTYRLSIAVEESVFVNRKEKKPTCFILSSLFAGAVQFYLKETWISSKLNVGRRETNVVNLKDTLILKGRFLKQW